MRFISWQEFAARTSVSLSTLKRLQASDPSFPTKIQISRHRVGFDEAASDRWLTTLAEQAEA
jgi:predicted DNA-binding transcriptional regulator AlpA